MSKAAYIVPGANTEGMKDNFGIWIGDNEGSKFWLEILNKLKNRGVKDCFSILRRWSNTACISHKVFYVFL